MGSAADKMASAFSNLSIPSPDPHYLLKEQYAADPSDKKILLGSGSYRDDDSRPWVLPSVAKAEHIVDQSQDSSRYEYLAIPGYAPFYTAARDLLLGKLGGNVDRVVSLHTLAGTGANFLGARFLKEALNPSAVWLSDPTWVNHDNIWGQAGVPIKRYPYWNAQKRQLDFERLIETLSNKAVAGDVIVLHACAHNPTGVDPDREQWKQIGDVCERKRLFPFFDCAYHGFASANLDRDAWAIQRFLSRGTMEVIVAQSFSKNMGLYGERVGTLHLVTSSADAALRAKGHLARLQRGQVSQPPNRGAKIATAILTSPSLFEEWLTDLQTICSRIQGVRERLYQELTRLETPGTWEHIRTQIGMFSYSGLTPQQVLSLQKQSHVYIVGTGRMSIASLSNSNVEYVAKAMDAAVRAHPGT